MRVPLSIAVMLALAASAAAAPTDGPEEQPRLPPASLQAALEHYAEIGADGGWPTVSGSTTLRPGTTDAAVPQLVDRLRTTGDLATTADPTPWGPPVPRNLYAGELVDGVRRFQRRHGLLADGIVGPRTRAALNVPVEARIEQLDLNIARAIRQGPAPDGRVVRVNIPAYWLELVEDGRATLQMPVVVGRPDRATPEFESAITFVVLNPTWTIPSKLAYQDMLPKVVRNPEYFYLNGIRVYTSWQRDAPEIDPDWIDWTLIGDNIKTLKLRQMPGPGNPLGRIKFHMANAFDVYLHDTPSRRLLARDRRAFSSGCVRVGDARGLLGELLRSNPEWPDERVDQVLAGRETTKIMLREPVPIHLYYQTAWATPDGRVHFREDLYDQDSALAAEFARGRRGPAAADALGHLDPLEPAPSEP